MGQSIGPGGGAEFSSSPDLLDGICTERVAIVNPRGQDQVPGWPYTVALDWTWHLALTPKFLTPKIRIHGFEGPARSPYRFAAPSAVHLCSTSQLRFQKAGNLRAHDTSNIDP